MWKPALAAALLLAAGAGARAAWAARVAGGRRLALAAAFAGGALLSAGLLHLLADARRALDEPEGYPWAELLCGVGCILTHALEAAAEAVRLALWPAGRPAAPEAGVLGATRGEAEEPPPRVLGRARVRGGSPGGLAGASPAEGRGDGVGSPSSGEPWEAADAEDRPLAVKGQTRGEPCAPPPAASPAPEGARRAGASRTSGATASGAGALLLLLALSFHSLLEGLSLGAASGARAAHLFLAILVHKGVAAFSLGAAWLAAVAAAAPAGAAPAGRAGGYALAMGAFACVTPAGVLLGMSVENSAAGARVTALSAGTFLYVGLVEACPGVKAPWLPWSAAGFQALAFASGFGAMALLALWT